MKPYELNWIHCQIAIGPSVNTFTRENNGHDGAEEAAQPCNWCPLCYFVLDYNLNSNRYSCSAYHIVPKLAHLSHMYHNDTENVLGSNLVLLWEVPESTTWRICLIDNNQCNLYQWDSEIHSSITFHATAS
ncbi:hypothetical protein GYMLUDRAFT_55502 [Collybiopsis luxurians FD-317 M1]|nr:hypothetical protein GYMLUDRAFT_55502 [Collybiopsis luxurians FD-317 M1]